MFSFSKGTKDGEKICSRKGWVTERF
ncbi:MAG: hypothetical protein RLZZ490_1241, partial [Cyanobacteriota bacterium]